MAVYVSVTRHSLVTALLPCPGIQWRAKVKQSRPDCNQPKCSLSLMQFYQDVLPYQNHFLPRTYPLCSYSWADRSQPISSLSFSTFCRHSREQFMSYYQSWLLCKLLGPDTAPSKLCCVAHQSAGIIWPLDVDVATSIHTNKYSQ